MVVYELAQEVEHEVKEHTPTGIAIVLTCYLAGVIAVFASAIILLLVADLGGFFWAMILLGAVVIVTLLSAAAFPYFQRKH